MGLYLFELYIFLNDIFFHYINEDYVSILILFLYTLKNLYIFLRIFIPNPKEPNELLQSHKLSSDIL
jgi:hypothetical protein